MELTTIDPVASPATSRADLRQRLTGLRAAACGADGHPEDAATRFLALKAELESMAQPVRRALLCSPLAWTEEEKADGGWLHRTYDDFASLGYRLSTEVAERLGMDAGCARNVIAATLFYMGETVKWDIASAPDTPHDLRKVHNLMRLAMEGGRQRVPMRMTVDGREADCTLESLYFRVLLLARFASGALNSKQIEILDTWIWMWMPVLSGVADPPPGTALRADLDSSAGLQLGPRESPGPSLYLPQGPIEAVYREVVSQFHAGHIVPETGIASEFRVEEHVAVLDLVRRNLRHARRDPVPRAHRHKADSMVEVHVGLAEIMKRGFAPAVPAARLSLATVGGIARPAVASDRDRHVDLDGIYDVEQRRVRLLDESETGLGLESSSADFGVIAAGELVAVRLTEDGPLIFGKVVRGVASKEPGRVVLGIRRMSAAAQLLDVTRESGSRGGRTMKVVFVPGLDSSGRHDACLVDDRDFADRSPLEVEMDGRHFRLRLNRVRECGRGWILAGFEVVTARAADMMEIA